MLTAFFVHLILRRNFGVGQLAGRDVLGVNYTQTSVIFRAAIEAVDVLVDSGKPFVLSVQVNPPVSNVEESGAKVP